MIREVKVDKKKMHVPIWSMFLLPNEGADSPNLIA